MRDKILDAAQIRIAAVGYNAVSFRDLAADVGVKSASVHYHFPQKSDLGVALVARYTERFQTALDQIDQTDARTAMVGFCALYADALIVDQSLCLCAILGAETISLPAELRAKVEGFFDMNVAWLDQLYARHGIKSPAPWDIVASLEGAMIVGTATRKNAVMETTTARILADF